jgi:malonate transporter MadL subunit
MAIYGTALLALCVLLGVGLGDELGQALHVRANVGGVGLGMLLLMAARVWLVRRGLLVPRFKIGIEFWALMYIPIVIAMAAQQNVRAALAGGPMVLTAGVGAVAVCFALVALLGRAARDGDA